MSQLFELDKHVKILDSVSLQKAMGIADAILRSDVYSETVRRMFDYTEIELTYINETDLKNLLDVSVITITLGRNLDQLGCRAATLSKYDPSRIYINPMLLLEIQTQEEEYKEYSAHAFDHSSVGLAFEFDGFNLCDFSTKQLRSRQGFNSLLYLDQLKSMEAYEKQTTVPPAPPALSADQRVSKKRKPNYWNKYQGLDLPPKSTTPLQFNDDKMMVNTLLLTILLVHEVSHLINNALSTLLEIVDDTGIYRTPTQWFRHQHYIDGTKPVFTDYGHMVERVLFGYVIHHSCYKHFKSPFAVEHIIGCTHEGIANGVILSPTEEFRAILLDPHKLSEIRITKELLQLRPGDSFEGQFMAFDQTIGAPQERESALGAQSRDSSSSIQSLTAAVQQNVAASQPTISAMTTPTGVVAAGTVPTEASSPSRPKFKSSAAAIVARRSLSIRK